MQRFLELVLLDQLNLQIFHSPTLAKRWLETNPCDIFLTDIDMPETTGIEMLKFAKSHNAWTQVIMLTGNSTFEKISQAMQSGASNYLLKPIERQDLITVVAQECSRVQRWKTVISGTLNKPAKAPPAMEAKA